MTGWRLGYGVWPAALVEGATRLAINAHSCVNAAAQYAGIAALTGPRDPVRDMVAAFDERRKVVVAELNAGYRQHRRLRVKKKPRASLVRAALFRVRVF